jgi:hypothetical protein
MLCDRREYPVKLTILGCALLPARWAS